MNDLHLPGLPGAGTWQNSPVAWAHTADTLSITAGAQTDLFIDPMGGAAKHDSPLLTFVPHPTFTLAAHVTVDFAATYDAGVLLVYADALHWGKFCFELSPHGEPTIVSVVTNGVSDDCNSVPLARNDIYMRVTRLGQAFAFHYSEDGRFWRLVRYFSLHQAGNVVAGFSSQSPTGAGCQASFAEIRYAPVPVSDVRSGV